MDVKDLSANLQIILKEVKQWYYEKLDALN